MCRSRPSWASRDAGTTGAQETFFILVADALFLSGMPTTGVKRAPGRRAKVLSLVP